MASWVQDRAPADARARHIAELAKRRNAQANDAFDFVYGGDEDGRHAKRCVFALAGGDACARAYDPFPYPDAAPEPARDYDGTGIGALYGLAGAEAHAWQLAGWNLVPGSSR